MTRLKQQMQLALRERRSWVLLVALWALLTVICGVAGPFGTHDALSLPARLGYWAVAVGLSVGSSVLPFMAQDRGRSRAVVVWTLYTVVLSGVIFALNLVFFEGWLHWRPFVGLLVNVALIVIAVHAILWLIDYAKPAVSTPDLDPQTRFLRRVPMSVRAPLVRIEAQDHYLNVVTTRGSALILMRLSEAVAELDGMSGLLVHRSHWVSLSEVRGHKRDKSRDLLIMSDGFDVPVSRSNRPAVKELGLI